MYVRPISDRLFKGRLTPAIRATGKSPLALLVTLVLADHQHHPVAADDLAFLAHRLDRRSYLHDPFRRLGSGEAALAAVAAAATSSWRSSRASKKPSPSSGTTDLSNSPGRRSSRPEAGRGHRGRGPPRDRPPAPSSALGAASRAFSWDARAPPAPA